MMTSTILASFLQKKRQKMLSNLPKLSLMKWKICLKLYKNNLYSLSTDIVALVTTAAIAPIAAHTGKSIAPTIPSVKGI